LAVGIRCCGQFGGSRYSKLSFKIAICGGILGIAVCLGCYAYATGNEATGNSEASAVPTVDVVPAELVSGIMPAGMLKHCRDLDTSQLTQKNKTKTPITRNPHHLQPPSWGTPMYTPLPLHPWHLQTCSAYHRASTLERAVWLTRSRSMRSPSLLSQTIPPRTAVTPPRFRRRTGFNFRCFGWHFPEGLLSTSDPTSEGMTAGIQNSLKVPQPDPNPLQVDRKQHALISYTMMRKMLHTVSMSSKCPTSK